MGQKTNRVMFTIGTWMIRLGWFSLIIGGIVAIGYYSWVFFLAGKYATSVFFPSLTMIATGHFLRFYFRNQ